MVNIVTINNQRYLVDVGYGANAPMAPVPLIHDHTFDQIAPVQGHLTFGPLTEFTDQSQRIWIYSTFTPGRDTDGGKRHLQYCFYDAEFFPADYEVMNYRTMTHPTSFFVQ